MLGLREYAEDLAAEGAPCCMHTEDHDDLVCRLITVLTQPMEE